MAGGSACSARTVGFKVVVVVWALRVSFPTPEIPITPTRMPTPISDRAVVTKRLSGRLPARPFSKWPSRGSFTSASHRVRTEPAWSADALILQRSPGARSVPTEASSERLLMAIRASSDPIPSSLTSGVGSPRLKNRSSWIPRGSGCQPSRSIGPPPRRRATSRSGPNSHNNLALEPGPWKAPRLPLWSVRLSRRYLGDSACRCGPPGDRCLGACCSRVATQNVGRDPVQPCVWSAWRDRRACLGGEILRPGTKAGSLCAVRDVPWSVTA